MSLFPINPNRSFGMKEALGLVAVALLMGLGITGYYVWGYLARHGIGVWYSR